jgi:hypothetical protein
MDRAGEGLVGSGYHGSLTDHQHTLLDQRPCDGRPGAGKDAGEGRPGNAHPFSGGHLIEPFEIGEPQSLELVESQLFDFEAADRASDGLERPASGHASDSSDLLRSCHFPSKLRTYAHYYQMSRGGSARRKSASEEGLRKTLSSSFDTVAVA